MTKARIKPIRKEAGTVRDGASVPKRFTEKPLSRDPVAHSGVIRRGSRRGVVALGITIQPALGLRSNEAVSPPTTPVLIGDVTTRRR